MDNFVLTISYLIIGVVLRKSPAFPKDSANVLNLFVIYVSLPALVLLKIPTITFAKDLLVPTLMPWGMLLVSALLILICARLFDWPQKVTGALLLLVPLGNTSFLGIPMVKALLGEDGVPFALIYDQLGSFLALATYGTIVLAYYGGDNKPSPKNVVLRILTFPPFIALVAAGLLFRNIPYHPAVELLLGKLASTLVPVVMIAVGFQLSLKFGKGVFKPFAIGLIIKLIVAPLLALSFCRALQLDSLAVNVAILEAGMPPMISAGALAIIAGLSPQLTAALVGFGILFSFATLPLLASFL